MNVLFKIWILSLLSFCLVSCQSSQKQVNLEKTSISEQQSRFLTQDEAQLRAKRLSEIHYKLYVDLTGDQTNFKGEMLIQFQLSDATSDLKLDSTDSQIINLKINGSEVPKLVLAKRSILLPQNFLKQGMNEVRIQYVGLYSHSGEGLHRFRDPEDKRDYLYTQFEDFDANRFMPCFDQPDLKAKLQLTVLAPKKWQVVTATSEAAKKKMTPTTREWVFAETPLISTYLYSLHAGEFKVWTSSFGKIPLRLFVRQSLAKYVTAEDWFKITREGLAFYQNYFATDYPFYKYDQLILPEFNAGAMENVAAVTFSERMVFRGRQTRDQRANTAETILHEMAHMWFGDLVTMKWWNDLWLNESFADFMENLATQKATEFKDADLDAFAEEKQWAYHEDQLVTTHPIEALVKNTDEAFLNFDGITYGKGSAVFKQLKYTIGADVFRDGVRSYFKKYAYKNTELSDFIAELALSSHQDLSSWSKAWLQDSGVDTLHYQIKCGLQKVESLDLELLSPSSARQDRSHAFEIAFLNEIKSQLKVTQTLRIVMNQKKMSVKDAVGLDCPKLIYPNYQDNDYVKFDLDPETIANLKRSFSKVEDPFLRLMFSTNLWQMVREQKLKIAEYADVALRAMNVETNSKVLKQLVGSISGSKRSDDNSVYYFMPTDNPTARLLRDKFVSQVENLYLENLHAARIGSDEQTLWLDALVHATESPAGFQKLSEILTPLTVSGKVARIPGLMVDQDKRWMIIKQMCRFDIPNIGEMLRSELKMDSSSRAKESTLACLASAPNLANKKSWFEKVTSEKSNESLEQVKEIAFNLFPYQQRDFLKLFTSDYFNFISKSFNRDQEYLGAVAKALVPSMCSEQSAEQINIYVKMNPQIPAVLSKTLRVAGQEDERCAKIQAYNR